MQKERLDILLVKKGLFDSREKARSSIMAGIVTVDGVREDKPGVRFPEDCSIDVKETVNPYVSRGGLKLEKAMKSFGISLDGKTAMDVGASTGGFTDCMLKNGAVRVFAVDVGYGQLAWQLRNDGRVINMERTNIRYVRPEEIGEQLDFVSIDVSFISLVKVLPAVKGLLKPDGEVLCLIKPQFEVGREKVRKHGVVRDESVHRQVVFDILSFCAAAGFGIKGLTYSPIKGPEGNIEYLAYLSLKGGVTEANALTGLAGQVVEASHANLDT